MLYNKKNLFIKRGLSILLIVGIFINYGNASFAHDIPASHTEMTNSTTWNFGDGWTDIYASSSIGFMGAEWSQARQAWGFNYRFVGTGASQYRNSGSSTNRIRIAAMQVEGTSNTSNMAMWTSTDSKYIGSTPSSTGSSPDYSDVATALVDLAITGLNSMGASLAWTTVGLINSLRSNVNSTSTRDDYIWRQWNWSPDISDTGQFFWFIVDVEPYQTVQISTEYMLFGPGYEHLSAGKTYRNLNAGAPRSGSLSTQTLENWNPGMMSDEEKEIYGIEEISREQFDERAVELNISSRNIEEFKSSDEEVFYFAHNFLEFEIPFSDNQSMTAKDTLIQDVNEQLKISENIIKAFTSIEEINDKDIEIIEKHKDQQLYLLDILNSVKSSRQVDVQLIDSIWNEFQAR